MSQVYIVYERFYREAYNAEPLDTRGIIKVFDDLHKTLMYIRDAIMEDHDEITESEGDSTHWTKYKPKPDEWLEGYWIKSLEYENGNYYESRLYCYKSYNVE